MKALDPDQRTLYVDFLQPPAGWELDVAVALTYSVDLDTLLSVPLHLALLAGEADRDELLTDGVAVLDALRRTSSRLLVFCERGRIRAPARQREIYSLLEPVLHELPRPSARGEGSFHPKLWLLRYTGSHQEREPFYRLVVLSRNVSADRSWDLSVTLEGRVTDEQVSGNEPLTRILESRIRNALEVPDTRVDQPHFQTLLREIPHIAWIPPEPFHEIRFHTLGPGADPWWPAQSDKLAVLTPFCSDQALEGLCLTTSDPALLVSRPEELTKLRPKTRHRFRSVCALHEAAVTEDGEEAENDHQGTDAGQDLHAKVYIAENDDDVRLYVGSANATNAALTDGRNVEFLVELRGNEQATGLIESLLAQDGFGSLLAPISDDALPEAPDDDPDQGSLDAVRRLLTGTEWTGRCTRSDEDEEWTVEVQAPHIEQLPDNIDVRVWPVTRDRRYAEPVSSDPSPTATFSRLLTSELTTLFAFEASVRNQEDGPVERFVLGVPLEGLPREERDAALKRQILKDPTAFIRYLLMLLSGPEDDGLAPWLGRIRTKVSGQFSSIDDLPLLESLVRAHCREPERLEDVRRLIADLKGSDHDQETVVPESFLELWSVFEERLETR